VATGSTQIIVPAIRAIQVTTIACAAEIERPPAPVINALDQP
jgi:hypothetical protein